MIKACEVDPERAIGALLPGAQFADAYRVTALGGLSDAMTAARIMVECSPVWVTQLMKLRNKVVKPLGLKDDDADDYGLGKIGFFPVVFASRQRVVLGLEDKHLDFRAVVDVANAGGVSHVTVTTLVRMHNLFGRAYLTAMLIVRTWLDKLARQSSGDAGSHP
jgi:Protein of unknown function (DUF2867)